MKCYVNKKDIQGIPSNGNTVINLLNIKNGCVAGCCSGISTYTETNYVTFGQHEDQEGFYVIEGIGWAIVDNEEFGLEPGVSFIVTPGKSHSIKRNENSCGVSIFWFHSAVQDEHWSNCHFRVISNNPIN